MLYNLFTKIVMVVAVAQEEECLSTYRKVSGWIPGPFGQHVKVSLGKILNPKLLLRAEPVVCEQVARYIKACASL